MTELPDASAVAEFLRNHPDFFEHHPALLAGLKLTTALGGRTVSLQERQAEVLREKIRQLELKLANLMRTAVSNDVILSNFHQWILRLLSAREMDDVPAWLLRTLRESFDVPSASLRLWDLKSGYENAWFAADAGDALVFANREKSPVCGPADGKPGVPWLDSSVTMQSAALVPLRKPGSDHSFGLLVMGSPDPQRFGADLATEFLTRIGEIASARLQSLID
jgi:uncharacterized protein YigA (DUF484 family)